MIPIIDVYLTGQCNYKCPYCYGESTDHFYMSEVIYEKVLSYAKYIGADVSFTGGEPLLHPKLHSFVSKAKRKEVNLHLHTNGILLEEHLDIIDSFDWVSISLDGTVDVNHKMRPNNRDFRITKQDKFDIPINNIFVIKNSYPQVKILLATLATSINIKNIEELSILLHVKKVPFDKWKIYQFTSNNFRSILTKNHFSIPASDMHDLEKRILSLHSNTVFKYGEGNCVLISVNGDIRINNMIVSNIEENHNIVSEKIWNTGLLLAVLENKQRSY